MAFFRLGSVAVVAWFGLLAGCSGTGGPAGTGTGGAEESGGSNVQCESWQICPSGDCPGGVGCEDELGDCEAGLCDCVLGADMCCDDGNYPPCDDEPSTEECGLLTEAERCGLTVGCGWVQTTLVEADFRDPNSCTKPSPDGNGLCVPSTPPPCPDPGASACGVSREMVFFVAPTVDGSPGTRVLTLDSTYACLDPAGFVGCTDGTVDGGSTGSGTDGSSSGTSGASTSGGTMGGTGPTATSTGAPTSGGTASYDTSSGSDTGGAGPEVTDICSCLCGAG